MQSDLRLHGPYSRELRASAFATRTGQVRSALQRVRPIPSPIAARSVMVLRMRGGVIRRGARVLGVTTCEHKCRAGNEQKQRCCETESVQVLFHIQFWIDIVLAFRDLACRLRSMVKGFVRRDQRNATPLLRGRRPKPSAFLHGAEGVSGWSRAWVSVSMALNTAKSRLPSKRRAT